MKKVLLSTSAIALASAVATSASANEWEVGVGGYMEQFMAYSEVDVSGDLDGDFDGIDVKSDAEIAFTPSITLDNGLQFGANVQLEANTSGDQIDESYLFIDGSFGEINLGSENSAGYKMTYAAPDVTVVGANSGSTTAFAPITGPNTGADFFRSTLGTTFLEVGANNDAQRITYYTPRFAGFQLGASYARDGRQDDNTQIDIDSGELHDIFDFGANYVNSFGDFNVAISGRYGFGSFDADDEFEGPDDDLIDDDDPRVWAVGANLGYAGFTIGGSYADAENDSFDDGESYDMGISYETGPWGASFVWFHGENVDDEALLAGVSQDEEVDIFLAGVSYTVAKGVKLGAFGGYQQLDEGDVDENLVEFDFDDEADVENWFIGVSTAIKF